MSKDNERVKPAADAGTAPPRRPLDPVHQQIVAERKALTTGKPGRPPAARTATRDVALIKQYDLVKAAGPAILARIIEGAQDRADPLHEKCLDIMVKRIAPIAFWESLAKQEFKPDEEQDKRPVINISINGSAGVHVAQGNEDDDVVSEQ